MYVQVGQVAGAQGHEVSVRAQIGLEIAHSLAVLGHAQRQFAGGARTEPASQRDLVAVNCRCGTGCRQFSGLVRSGDGEVGAEGQALLRALGCEVGEDAVAAGLRQIGGCRPGAVGVQTRMQMAIDRQIA